jgi:hypothetical protein
MYTKLVCLLISVVLLSLAGCAEKRMQSIDKEVSISRISIILDAPRVRWAHEISKNFQRNGFEVHRTSSDTYKPDHERLPPGARYIVVVHAYKMKRESDFLSPLGRFEMDIVDSRTGRIIDSFHGFGENDIRELALKISSVLIHLPD